MGHDYWPSGVPRGAQQMLCSDFSAKCKQMLRDRDHGEREWTIFRCPSCGRAAEQEHGVQSSCCDLMWVGYGNGLYVWGVDGEPVARNLNPLFINGVQQFRGMPETPEKNDRQEIDRLWQAAPALLAACKLIARPPSGGTSMSAHIMHIVNVAEDAIAKAEGRS